MIVLVAIFLAPQTICQIVAMLIYLCYVCGGRKKGCCCRGCLPVAHYMMIIAALFQMLYGVMLADWTYTEEMNDYYRSSYSYNSYSYSSYDYSSYYDADDCAYYGINCGD